MSATLASGTAPARVDARSMSRLSMGHSFVDLCQGSVPALLPTLIAVHHLNLASATALISIASIGSAVIQPIFGIWSDRITAPVLAPLGVLLASLGIASIGFCSTYPQLALAVGLSGVGVALFHPEGARMAHLVGGGSVRGMSYFSVGGNVGFAAGPVAVLIVLAIGGLSATPLLAIPGIAIATLLLLDVERLKGRLIRAAHAESRDAAAPAAQWGPFSRLVSAAVARTVPMFALLAFIPVYVIHNLHSTHTAGNLALTTMLLAGAAGTLAGGRLADRFGKRTVVRRAMPLLILALLVLPVTGLVGLYAVLILVGFSLDLPFSTTVVLGQQYLPGRRGLASGITFGLAIGVGALMATALGVLADAIGIHTTLMILPVFAILALGFALSLPEPRA
jgi:MFS transporter, FSR family, fosmidomycin resistance protein